MIFRPRQKQLYYLPRIFIHDIENDINIPLENKEYVKYLGILIDQNLSWKNHIDNISTKISRHIGLIARLRHFVPFNTLLTIYRSLILPYQTYGLPVWGQACKTYLNKVLLLQKRALRFMYFANRQAHALPLFKDTKSLPLSFLYYRSCAMLMHDVSTGTAPSNLLNQFKNISDVHSYNTRSSTSKNLYISKFSLEIQNNYFVVFGSKLWNAVSASTRNLPKKIFKTKLKSLLFHILSEQDDYIDPQTIVERVQSSKFE